MKTFASLSAAVALLSGSVDAFWRMECHSRTGLARLDPIVTPGRVSSHAHAIHGGNNFGLETTYEDLRKSKCTSCLATDDKSAYWTPAMMFQHENGTTEVVQQVGGMLAYYLLFKNDGETIEAFPEGFRMLAGDAGIRNFSGPVPDKEKSLWGPDDKTQFSLGQKALGMNCLNYAKDPEPSMYRHFLPDKAYMDANCVNGIRAEIFFPSCWNGEKDSTNHKDHMAYPDLVNGGVCPKGFNKRVPSLFFETIWDTYAFKGLPGQYVFANGDPTGSGYHGDFMMGWSKDTLQAGIEQCTNPSGLLTDCPVFDLQTEADCDECHFEVPEVLSKENCAGPGAGLCGDVQVQAGPEYASNLTPGNTAPQTASPTSIVLSTAPAVPTLSYTTPKSAATDEYGGGISIQNAAGMPSQTRDVNPEAVLTPTASSTSSSSSSSSSSSASAPAAPAPTEMIGESPEQPKPSVVGTTTYTSAGVVYDVVLEEVAVYVTVDATPQKQKARRHAHHMHHRRDREHGLLRRH